MADNRTIWHCAIMQEREKNQMFVFRWLAEHPQEYKTIWIRHDRDKKPKIIDGETIDNSNGENDDGCVVDETGIVLPHYHVLIKLPDKQSPQGLTCGFGHYVNFQRCSNPRSYFLYLLHRSFKASLDENKHVYEISDLQTNDDDFLKSMLTGSGHEMDIERRVFELIQLASGSVQRALHMSIEMQEWDCFKEIKRHSYFYIHFFE